MAPNPDRDRLDLERTLADLGIEPGCHRVLMLLPLVYVAWADGRMDRVEVERLEHFARERLHFTAHTAAVLDGWLRTAPTREYVERGLVGLLGVALDEEMLAVEVAELPDLLHHAESIARATADALDDPTAITADEEQALADIARLLGIDGGTTWKDVLNGVRTMPPPAG